MNKLMAMLLAFVLGITFVGNISASAVAENHTSTVNISVDSTVDNDTGILSCVAEIDFPEDKSSEDELYLSYHIKDEAGNIIGFENPRYPVNSEDNHSVEFDINGADMLLRLGAEKAYIAFDIVDAKNGFWYSINPQYQIESDELSVEGINGRAPDASLVLTKTEQSDSVMLCTAEITFSNPELVNDSLFLSYHITDLYGNEIQYENERFPLSVKDGKAEATLNINAAEVIASKGLTEGIVTFDIVDTQNIFWYLDTPFYYFVTERFTVDASDYIPQQDGGNTEAVPPEQTEQTEPTDQPESAKEVSITCNYPESTLIYELNPHVEIYFNDSTLYNEKVKLSYRIYDEDMNVISEENERFELSYADGKAEADINISLTKCGVKKGQNVTVKFDLVDEQNIYWFSKNENIHLSTQDISVEYDWLKDVQMTYLNLVINQPVQLAVNILVLVVVIIIAVKLKKVIKN